MFLKQQIGILEWFLKDHVTLTTAVMAAKNSALRYRNKSHFKVYYNKNKKVIFIFYIS